METRARGDVAVVARGNPHPARPSRFASFILTNLHFQALPICFMQHDMPSARLLSLIAAASLLVAASPVRQAQAIGNDLHDAQAGNRLGEQVKAVCEKVKVFCPDVIIKEQTAWPIESVDGNAVISADMAGLVQSRQEEVALAALVVAWSNRRDARPPSSDIPQQLVALGVFGIGEAIDPLRDQADRNRRSSNLQYVGAARSGPATGVAANALAFTAAAGGCSGALVDLMRRAGAVPADASGDTRRRAMFATSVLRQFGSAIMPPDRHCIAD